MQKLILASGSPRRRELMHYIWKEFQITTSEAEDTVCVPKLSSPEDLPVFLSRVKAEDIASKNPGAIVVGADTVVISPDGEILGKPKDQQDARHMLKKLSGAAHRVVTGVSICQYTGSEKRLHSFREITEVVFFPLTDAEIDHYVESNEPMDKAGAYGIQGLGSLLVEKIDGDFFNVVGLPVARLKRELDGFSA